MIAYVTVGADDIDCAKRFYFAFLPALGYGLERFQGDLSYVLPVQPGQSPVLPDFYVKSPFDGCLALPGNGTMTAFQTRSQKQVRDLHSAALAAGGFDEGQPGFRNAYGPHFMLAIFATLMVTRSHCSPAMQTNPDATDNTGFAGHKSRWFARQI